MKILVFTTLNLLCIQFTLLSQSCLPEGITFLTQTEINNFQNDYPDCTQIEGGVIIGSYDESDINNLNGLNVITSIEGGIWIINLDHLKNLSGLNNLTTLGANLNMQYNDSITNFSGLESLNSIDGSINLENNPRLSNFSGLEALNYIGEDLKVYSHYALTSLSGLNNVTFIGGELSLTENISLVSIAALSNVTHTGGRIFIKGSNSLSNLIGLENITSIGGDFTLYGNDALSNLEGINNLTSIQGNFELTGNYMLSDLSALENLTHIGNKFRIILNISLTNLFGLENITPASIIDLHIYDNENLSTCDVESICNYLTSPNGEIEIYGNSTGCNSQEEIEAACDTVSISEINFEDPFIISPNPCSGSLDLQFTLSDFESVILDLYEITGVKIRQLLNEEFTPGSYELEFDLSKVPKGIYFCTIKTNNGLSSKKLIKL